MTNEIHEHDGLGQAELIAKGKCSAEEVLEAAIARIEERNPELNAVIHFTFDKARAQTAPEPGGKFTPEGGALFGGVPVLYKDLMCTVAGDPHHCGSRALKNRNATSQVDSFMHQRFMAAGFRCLGRTNVPEFGHSTTTESLAYGPARNPWNPDYSTGGSSGGSGAAVAAGMVPIAHGNDAGGSIRIPASVCGLVGLKPTRARISVGPEFGESGPLSHQGVLTRTVRDTAAALDVLSGMHAGDPYVAPPPTRPYLEEVSAKELKGKSPLKGLRVGFMTFVPGGGEELHPECLLATQNACKLLEDLGCVVEEAFPSRMIEPTPVEFGTVMNANLLMRLAYWERQLGEPFPREELEPFTAIVAERGKDHSSLDLAKGLEALHAYSREVCGWWDGGYDLLLTPTLPIPPWKIGELSPELDIQELIPRVTRVNRFMSTFNITGQPAISLPLHRTPENLPVGIQFVARYGRDDLLIRLASVLEPSFR